MSYKLVRLEKAQWGSRGSAADAAGALPLWVRSPALPTENRVVELSQEADSPAYIVAAIHKGDRGAETLLYQRYHRAVFFVLKRKCDDAQLAQDLSHDVFTIAIERLRREGIDKPHLLSAFLHGVAVNLYLAYLRKNHRVSGTPLIDAVPGEENLDEDLWRQRAIDAVRSAILSMTNERDRVLLFRYYVRDEEKEKICNDLNLQARHFDRVLYRARQRIKQLLAQYREE